MNRLQNLLAAGSTMLTLGVTGVPSQEDTQAPFQLVNEGDVLFAQQQFRAITKKVVEGTVEFKSTFPDGSGKGCTGAIVGENKILTVEHCVTQDTKQGKTSASKIEITANDESGGQVNKTSPWTLTASQFKTYVLSSTGYDDGPAVIALSKSLFPSRALPIATKALEMNKVYCVLHVEDYDTPHQSWKRNLGILKGQDAAKANLNFYSVIHGNSGTPLVDCQNGSVYTTLSRSNGKAIIVPNPPPAVLSNFVSSANF